MAFKTLDELTQTVIQELALVPGSSVQTYNEPIIMNYIQEAFDHLFKKRFWNHLTATTFHTLDGAGGVITDTLSDIEDLTDIKWIRQAPYRPVEDLLPHFSDIPYEGDVLCWSAIPATNALAALKRVQFFPKTSTASIALCARRKPADFSKTDPVLFDHLTIRHFVTASLLAVDGMNPNAQQRQEVLFDDRYQTLVANESTNTITYQSRRFAKEFTVAE